MQCYYKEVTEKVNEGNKGRRMTRIIRRRLIIIMTIAITVTMRIITKMSIRIRIMR